MSRFILPFADVGNGISPASGAKLFFFESGTSTNKDTFADEALTAPNSNPVISNADGVFPRIWLGSGRYKAVLKTKNSVQEWEADAIEDYLTSGSLFVENFQDLRDLPVNSSDTMYVKGSATPGDGGESFFQRKTGAVGFYVDDNDQIIVPSGGDGSVGWIKKFREYIIPTSSVASMKLLTNLIVGSVAKTASFYAGLDKGSAVYDVVLTSGVTPNLYNIIISTADALLSFVLRETNPLNLTTWGCAGDGAVDDTLALQNVINHSRDQSLTLIWEEGTYRTTASIKNQHDASFKETNWIVQGATLVPDFSGSEALIIEGGSFFQNIDGRLNIIPSVAQRMTPVTYANRDAVTHGIVIESSRIKMSGKFFISSMKGHGIVTRSNAGGNSNGSEYNAYVELCNSGWVCAGVADDLAVVKCNVQVTTCASTGFDGLAGCNVRNWDAHLQLENNCIIDTGNAGFQVDKATGGKWFIYSEQQNVSNEIEFNNLSVGNNIFSCRANKDVFVDGNFVTGGNGVHKRGFIQTFTPVVVGSTAAGTATYSVQTGRYQQIGNMIHFTVSVVWTVHTGTGNLRINDLPGFPVGANGVSFAGVDIAGIASGEVPMGSVNSNKRIDLFKNVAGVTGFMAIQATGSIQVSGTYEVQ